MQSLFVIVIVPALCELHRALSEREQMSPIAAPIICSFILLAMSLTDQSS